jgi:hypothetical protein
VDSQQITSLEMSGVPKNPGLVGSLTKPNLIHRAAGKKRSRKPTCRLSKTYSPEEPKRRPPFPIGTGSFHNT